MATQIFKNMEIQGNMLPPKKQNKTLVAHPKEMEICGLPVKRIQNNHLKDTQ
jgi:hypothetical protein